MTAKEAMQALLDGKTVVTDGHTRYVLNDKGYIGLDHGPIREEPCGSFLNSVVEVIEEYPLTFEQALREMLNGKIVMCEVFNDREYLFSDGWFRFLYHNDNWIQADWFEMRMRDAKWKVVE